MKTIKHLFQLVVISLVVLTTSCARDFDEPPLMEPNFVPTGKVIEISQLKEMYATLEDNTNELMTAPYFIKGMVVANDISGNIFKQVYIQDATGGLYMGVDQSNVSTEYGVGQTVYVELRDLYAVKYGGQLQIGYGSTQANRIPWEIFKEHTHKHQWANAEAATPRKVKIADLTDAMVNTIVQFDNVEFIKLGNGLFIDPSIEKNGYTEQPFKDAAGKQIIIRTSQYFNAVKKQPLPSGKGTVIGVLGKFGSTWQLVLRDVTDVRDFKVGGTDPELPSEKPVFLETFGTTVQGEDKKWPTVADFKNYDEKLVQYSDASGKVDIRTLKDGNSHAWFSKGQDTYLTIKGINTEGKSNLKLTYDAAASVFNEGESTDLANIEVRINGVAATVPSKVVVAKNDVNVFYTMTVSNFPAAKDVTLEFYVANAKNEFGLRIDNIKIESSPTINPSSSN